MTNNRAGTMGNGVQEALLSEAFIRGRRDGGAMFSPANNPYQVGSVEHEQWRQGRDSAIQSANDYANACIKRDQLDPLRNYAEVIDRDSMIGRRVA
jgi:hypothetical protein